MSQGGEYETPKDRSGDQDGGGLGVAQFRASWEMTCDVTEIKSEIQQIEKRPVCLHLTALVWVDLELSSLGGPQFGTTTSFRAS